MARLLAKEKLGALIRGAMDKKYRVVGPAREHGIVLFGELSDPAALCLDELNTQNSVKEFFFPKTEPILKYALGKHDVALADDFAAPRTVLIGGRACDARSLVALDRLFGWDYKDKFYFARREATCVITLACDRFDEACFCTSLGFGPRAPEGSDVLLVPVEGDAYLVEVVTDKGGALVAELADIFTEGTPGAEKVAYPEKKFELAAIKPWLERNFEHPFWNEEFLACLGCGTCTYQCPACYCFEIVDEGDIHGGQRCKNWDSCQLALFTRHTSGHNPRPTQASRWRQRLSHKFAYYPGKFGYEACVGCGRCIRNCPVGLSILDKLVLIGREAAAAPAEPAGAQP